MNCFSCFYITVSTLSVVCATLVTRGTFYRSNSEKEIDVDSKVISSFHHNCAQSKDCPIINEEADTNSRSDSKDSERWIKTDIGVMKNQVFADCKDMYTKGVKESGPVQLSWGNGSSFSAYCDMETKGGGWTVIQRRINSPINFNRQWNEYVRGFGNVEGSFWLGLKAMHHLTKSGKITLRFDLKNKNGQIGYAEYNTAKIESESQQFAIKLGKFTGNIGDAMQQSNEMRFSSFDKDNDVFETGNCAEFSKGGWWHNKCFLANLNAVYPGDQKTPVAPDNGWMTWYTWEQTFGSITRSEMKLHSAD